MGERRKLLDLPAREKLLKHVFANMVAHYEWRSDQFHAFCVWAKGRSKDDLLGEIGG